MEQFARPDDTQAEEAEMESANSLEHSVNNGSSRTEHERKTMKNGMLVRIGMVWLLVIGMAFGAWAQTKVKGYTRKDGTVVRAHTRAAPGSAVKQAAPAVPRQAIAPRPVVRPSPAPVTRAPNVVREVNGSIARSSSARRDFMKATGYPNGRPGYVVDHIKALKRGGADSPANMQWQSVAEAKAKDKWE